MHGSTEKLAYLAPRVAVFREIKCNNSHSRSFKVNVHKRFFSNFYFKVYDNGFTRSGLPRSFKVIHNDTTTL